MATEEAIAALQENLVEINNQVKKLSDVIARHESVISMVNITGLENLAEVVAATSPPRTN